MIVNPSVQTMIPGRRAFRKNSFAGRRQMVTLPGGKLLWFGVAKASLVSFLFLFTVSAWSTYSVEQINNKVEQAEAIQSELVNSNILLRAQKAQLYSPEQVERLAGQNLALHFPDSGQYRKF